MTITINSVEFKKKLIPYINGNNTVTADKKVDEIVDTLTDSMINEIVNIMNDFLNGNTVATQFENMLYRAFTRRFEYTEFNIILLKNRVIHTTNERMYEMKKISRDVIIKVKNNYPDMFA